MGDMVAPKAGIHQAFATADITISQGVCSIINLLQRPGLIRIGFDDLLTALRSENGRCLFGYGESDSDNRAHDALRQALKNPLMDKGKMLADAAHVLVQVAGGPAMTLSEVEILMQEFGRHVSECTQIIFGTAVDSRMGNRLSVTIISSLAGEGEQAAQQTAAPAAAVTPPPQSLWEELPAKAHEIDTSPETAAPEPAEIAENLIAFEEPPAPPPITESDTKAAASAPRLIVPKKKPAAAATTGSETKPPKQSPIQAKQEVMQFEPATRGRFEKSEPTIVEGQDLDVPTFLRKSVRVK
jgi:cell division protein FtsZ